MAGIDRCGVRKTAIHPKKGVFMARVPDLVYEELSAEHRKAYDEIAGTRGGAARGPFSVLLRTSPEISLALSRLGDTIRFKSKLERRYVEIATLVVARRWRAAYVWAAHAKTAVEVGVAPAVVEAIRKGEKPTFEHDDERLIYEIGIELFDTGTLCQNTYDRALAGLGIDVLAEATLCLAFYMMGAFVANAFDVEVPGNIRPFDGV
jgi:4-carboxymuconolactone decarboxylase